MNARGSSEVYIERAINKESSLMSTLKDVPLINTCWLDLLVFGILNGIYKLGLPLVNKMVSSLNLDKRKSCRMTCKDSLFSTQPGIHQNHDFSKSNSLS